MGLDKIKVEKFIKACMEYLGDLYSMARRLEKGFSDCSSIIQKALTALGWNTRPNVTVTTHRMGIEGDSRFREIPINSIERGDIVWWVKKDETGKPIKPWYGHVGIYLGNQQVLEAIKPRVAIKPLSRLGWQKAYRIVALETREMPVITKTEQLKGVVTAKNLNVRDLDSTTGKILGQIKLNTEVEITGKTKNNWYEIDYKGKKAYVSNSYVKVVKNAIENVDILINGKLIKKGYIIDGVTFATINGKDLPVRQLFENMGAKVEWKNKRVEITL